MRRRKPYFIPLVILCLLSSFYIMWQLIWNYIYLQRNMPVAFDVSLLQELHYLRELSSEDQKEPLRQFGYNIVESHVVKPNRILPTTRHYSCGLVSSHVTQSVPSISIIITFQKVDRSVLLRNIVSILIRSEPAIIQEIILVDDGAPEEEDGKLLSKLPGVKVIRNKITTGRGAARMQGAAQARGEIFVFVDSHVEVNVDWLSPLVLRLMESPKSLVAPVFDRINSDTFEYTDLPTTMRGGFDWSLQYRWEDVPTNYHTKSDSITPFRSPVVSGSVVAVRKDFFNWLDKYDAGGNEDMELSVRAWMCGGQVEIIPCSRVGLVQVKGLELGLPAVSYNNFLKSCRRLAEVWLDEYKRFFYAVRPSARMQPMSDVSSLRKLKQTLKCHSFKWFLTFVYPQLQPLVTDEIAYGNIRQGDSCIDLDPGQLPVVTKLRLCVNGKDSQEWSWRKRGVIVSNGMCLTSDLMNMQGFVVVQFCKDLKSQLWYRHNEKVVHVDTNLCLNGRQGDTGLLITDCIKDDPTQAWTISTEKKSEYLDLEYSDPEPWKVHDHPL